MNKARTLFSKVVFIPKVLLEDNGGRGGDMQGQQFLVLIEARLSNLPYAKVQVIDIIFWPGGLLSQARTPLRAAPLSERRRWKKRDVWGGREASGAELAPGDLRETDLVPADRQLLHQLPLPCRFPWQTAPIPQSPTRQRCFEPLTVRTTSPRPTAVGQTFC